MPVNVPGKRTSHAEAIASDDTTMSDQRTSHFSGLQDAFRSSSTLSYACAPPRSWTASTLREGHRRYLYGQSLSWSDSISISVEPSNQTP